MIHVDLQMEPEDFDSRIRQPGMAFLSRCSSPRSSDWDRHRYWSICSNQLYSAYKGICAYTGQWFSKTVAAISVDHFYPKSTHPEKAYEWDNYRLTTQIINGYKADKIILDPFEIDSGDISLNFPSCLVKPRGDMSPAQKSKAIFTIRTLRLNNEDQITQRYEIVLAYIQGCISRSFLEQKFPFIAEELARQNLYDSIKDIFKCLPQAR